MTQFLSDTEINAALADLDDGWTREGDTIKRSVAADTFAAGIALVDAVAKVADEHNHHPDIDIRWTTITFALSTHSEGGLTEKDFAMAAEIDALAGDRARPRGQGPRPRGRDLDWTRSSRAASPSQASARACSKVGLHALAGHDQVAGSGAVHRDVLNEPRATDRPRRKRCPDHPASIGRRLPARRRARRRCRRGTLAQPRPTILLRVTFGAAEVAR